MSDEPCELLRWDSDFFGITIARVKDERLTDDGARRINEWCRDHRVRCLYYSKLAEVALACAEVLRRENFEFMDAKLTMEHRGDAPPAPNVRAATPADLQVLEDIAAASHRGGRFERDLRFPRGKSQEMFRVWIRAAAEKEHVLVADVAGKPAGYSACKLTDEGGLIWLLAVDEAARGRGLAEQLVKASLSYFGAKGKPRVTVVTQAWNAPGQRLYQRCGFVTSRCDLTYHKWFE